MKKKIFALLAAGTLVFSLAACSGGPASYKDGTYEGQSSMYEDLESEDENGGGNGYGVVTIAIKDNEIVDCEYLTYELDGTLKDEEYGKHNGVVTNADWYNKAQKAVRASAAYAEQLKETGSLDEVEAISGATISYNLFGEAVEAALDSAKE